ncbi:uncharacterized protein RSE6_03448 [Rhynchosporium secalis]|uniref:Uncharacterized protein n=1 Tax=Rhynchosporium secalis TaxID=38038 RepID=A0A1E1M2T8_RHYSE|nr:uncharacterized protein RSE6_03448 [Rhynchosporium secalis]
MSDSSLGAASEARKDEVEMWWEVTRGYSLRYWDMATGFLSGVMRNKKLERLVDYDIDADLPEAQIAPDLRIFGVHHVRHVIMPGAL